MLGPLISETYLHGFHSIIKSMLRHKERLFLAQFSFLFFFGYNGNTQSVLCLSSAKLFVAIDVKKLLKITEFYPNDFIEVLVVALHHQVKNYVINVRSDPKFAKLKGLSDLCAKLVETNKCNTFAMVYKLLKLDLLLPVATASVEHIFSPMKVVKSNICNKMDDQWLNVCLVTYI